MFAITSANCYEEVAGIVMEEISTWGFTGLIVEHIAWNYWGKDSNIFGESQVAEVDGGILGKYV